MRWLLCKELQGVTRAKKKLLGKSTWFKGGGGGRGTRPTNTGTASRTRIGKAENAEGGTGSLETRSVILVEHTPDGTLAKRLREQVGRMEHIMGFRLKVVEKTGTKLKDMFSPTNVWGGSKCEREDCTTCTQGCEDLPDCTRRSIVYESICSKCNPGAKEQGPLRNINKDVPSVYVGETSRSIYEHAGEHWNSYRKRNTDSHIWKHHLVHHDGEGEPEMVFKMVGKFKTALITRQFTEAVTIRKMGNIGIELKK